MTDRLGITLYVGATNNLFRRVLEHINKLHPESFTARNNLTKLVYYEMHKTIELALAREKQIKGGSRQKKLNLINAINPNWQDLFHADVKHWKN